MSDLGSEVHLRRKASVCVLRARAAMSNTWFDERRQGNWNIAALLSSRPAPAPVIPTTPAVQSGSESSTPQPTAPTTIAAAAVMSAQLEYHERAAPMAVLALAEIGGITPAIRLNVRVDINPKTPPKLTLDAAGAPRFEGTATILRWCARAGGAKAAMFRDDDAVAATQIDQWIDWSVIIQPGQGLPNLLKQIDAFVGSRAFLVGSALSLADVAMWGALASMPMWENKLKKDAAYANLARWHASCGKIPAIAAAVSIASAAKGSKGKASGGKDKGGKGDDKAVKSEGGGSFDVKLEGAEMGKVVTRFPPEPSGFLHIGHTKAVLLNQYFANAYKGKLIVRFDDTNPSKEKDEFVDNIMNDLKSLEVKPSKLSYTSDYFPNMLTLAEKLLKKGVLYADDTPVEKMREERMEGIDSARRTRSPADNLAIWDQMKLGSPDGLKNCLRIKLDMQNPNKALRDPVCFRCNLTPHHRTGVTYKVYPTYDFACPFVDSIEGVTHALRTNEYKDRDAQYHWILRLQQSVQPSLPHVSIWEFSRLNFVNTVMSKRKLQWFVDTGKVDGWNDPRFPTVQGLIRRGLTVQALRDFILLQGASKNTTFQEWDKLWTMNKKIIDPVCPRHTAIVASGKVPLTFTNGPSKPEVIIVPRHKKYPPAGKKATTKTATVILEGVDAAKMKEGEEITLMDWGNCFVDTVSKDGSGAIVSMTGRLNPEGSVKTTKLKVTWLPDIADLVSLDLVFYDHIITKKKIEEGDNIADLVNADSMKEEAALGDANMRSLNKGEVLQLERKGYFIVDEPYISAKKPMTLLYIPDGRSK